MAQVKSYHCHLTNRDGFVIVGGEGHFLDGDFYETEEAAKIALAEFIPKWKNPLLGKAAETLPLVIVFEEQDLPNPLGNYQIVLCDENGIYDVFYYETKEDREADEETLEIEFICEG